MKNNTNDNFINDEQLLVLLDSKEAGKSFSDALTALGSVTFSLEETQTLKSLWDTHGNLMREAHDISPRRSLISRIIAQAEVPSVANVTTQTDQSYIQYSQGLFISLNNKLHAIMKMNWKIASPIIAVVLIVTGVAMNGGTKDASRLAVGTQEITSADAVPEQAMTMSMSADAAPRMVAMKAAPAVPVSGNIDDLMASITREGDGDLALRDGSAEDAALVRADSQTINDFNTAYDETTF